MPVRILLVDDHAVVRAGLRALLEGEPDLVIVGETADGATAVDLCRDLLPDVVLMDVRLTDGGGSLDGIETTRQVVQAVPDTAVVMLTSYSTRSDVVRAMRAGARGYVLKAGPPEELFHAVRTAATGGIGLAPEAADKLVRQVVDPEQTLTDREVDVVRLLAQGLSNRALAATLFLTEATVKTHLIRIYRKLRTDNRAGALSEALRRGYVELGHPDDSRTRVVGSGGG
jgi:DNA-binding NarL/FixJ family response regulator